ncbi:hypothetical protein [Salmonirosea aquatica]|uniref:Beta-lactamase-inhibitor-like PepSY-like domain-containing protein n=1 Tax=Salmonirosea aquatica TaxID=2654236 RepID=A0A7C9BFT8_9BACT|nr:hypothetical protein [Cytophagaceae bacterium SJW1-29]
MRKIKPLPRMITCLILILPLRINSTFAQCSEFTISDYEKMVDMPFSDLGNFVSKKGYVAYNDEFFVVACKNGENSVSSYFGIKNKTINLLGYSSFKKDSFVEKLISNGYTIQQDYSTLVYGNERYLVEIVDENSRFNIRMRKVN